MRSALSEDEIARGLAGLPGWSLAQGPAGGKGGTGVGDPGGTAAPEILRWWQFADFAGAIEFVGRVAALAEKAGHHPDIDIRYNRVRLALSTHDAGGLTPADFALAAAISQQAPPAG